MKGFVCGNISDCEGDISEFNAVEMFARCHGYPRRFLTSVPDGDEHQASPFTVFIPVNSLHYPLEKTPSVKQTCSWCGSKQNITATNETQLTHVFCPQ